MLYYLTRNIKFTIPIGLHNTFDRFGHVMNKNYPDNTVSAYIQRVLQRVVLELQCYCGRITRRPPQRVTLTFRNETSVADSLCNFAVHYSCLSSLHREGQIWLFSLKYLGFVWRRIRTSTTAFICYETWQRTARDGRCRPLMMVTFDADVISWIWQWHA